MHPHHKNRPYPNITTYYVPDASGNTMAIYDNNGTTLQQKEIPVYAASRIGIYTRANNSYQYELTDHLGNVRVVISQNKIGGLADVIYYSDYYSYGSPLTLANNDYRFGYQGQYAEKDKETNWNAFDLRNYDAAIGRWLNVDPYGEHWSPYLGMGNNPVVTVDPDGGCEKCPKVDDSPSKFTKPIALAEVVVIGFKNGFNSGFNSSWDLITNQMWTQNFWRQQGLFAQKWNLGIAQREIYSNISSDVRKIPDMNAYELSYATGYCVEKFGEGIALSKGLGLVGSAVRSGEGLSLGNYKILTNANNKGLTLLQKGNGKQFRIDFDGSNGVHYHRRGVSPNGNTIPGQGIGRHRPWQSKSTDTSFWNRF